MTYSMGRLLAAAAVGVMLAAGPAVGPAGAVGDEPTAGQERPGGQTRTGRAVRMIERGAFEDAIALLKRVVREEENNANAWNWLGFASRKTGDLEASEVAYDRALALEPDHKGALEYQGELRLMQNNLAAAEGNLAKLAQLCPAGCEQYEDLKTEIAAYKQARALAN